MLFVEKIIVRDVECDYFISQLFKEIQVCIVIFKQVVGIKAYAKLIVGADKAQNLVRRMSQAGPRKVLYGYLRAAAMVMRCCGSDEAY